jgi:hypothetical protein
MGERMGREALGRVSEAIEGVFECGDVQVMVADGEVLRDVIEFSVLPEQGFETRLAPLARLLERELGVGCRLTLLGKDPTLWVVRIPRGDPGLARFVG